MSCGSGVPAEVGAVCAAAALTMHKALSAYKIIRALRRTCSLLVMANSNTELT
jgi:hypothetical protein